MPAYRCTDCTNSVCECSDSAVASKEEVCSSSTSKRTRKDQHKTASEEEYAWGVRSPQQCTIGI